MTNPNHGSDPKTPKKSSEIFMQKSGGTERAFLLSFFFFFHLFGLGLTFAKSGKGKGT